MNAAGDRPTLIAAARETARGMAAAVAGQASDCRVTVKGDQFRVIATLLAQLAEAADASAMCECMGRPIDGVRFWVPHDQLAQARAQAAQLTAEVAGLRDSLKFAGDVIRC